MSPAILFGAWLIVLLCLAPFFSRWSKTHSAKFEQRLIQALESFHIFIRPQALRPGLIAALMLAIALTFLLIQSIWLLPILIFGLGFGTLAFIRFRLHRRFKQIRQQLPGVMELLATSLRAGLSLRAAFVQVSRQSPNPIAKELAVLERMQRVGIQLEEAVLQWSRRIPLDEIGLLGFAVGVSASSGGNLADTLDRLSATFRQRLLLEEKVDALTSQGRLQAWVMVALPIALALVLTMIDPHSMSALWFTGAGHAVIAGVLVLEFLGLMWIRRLIRIDI